MMIDKKTYTKLDNNSMHKHCNQPPCLKKRSSNLSPNHKTFYNEESGYQQGLIGCMVQPTLQRKVADQAVLEYCRLVVSPMGNIQHADHLR